MASSLTIGQLAQATGVSAKTIRYYEQAGVLPAPNRSASGYRQYFQRDVHRLLFIRRARALGLSLQDLKTLTTELNSGPCATLRPRLLALVQAQLQAVQQHITEFQLLQRQLEQVRQRLLTAPPTEHAEGCQCLEIEAAAIEPQHPRPPSSRTQGGASMDTPALLEHVTLLTTCEDGSCGCGCGLPLVQLSVPQSTAATPAPRPRFTADSPGTGVQEKSSDQEVR